MTEKFNDILLEIEEIVETLPKNDVYNATKRFLDILKENGKPNDFKRAYEAFDILVKDIDEKDLPDKMPLHRLIARLSKAE